MDVHVSLEVLHKTPYPNSKHQIASRSQAYALFCLKTDLNNIWVWKLNQLTKVNSPTVKLISTDLKIEYLMS